LAAEGGGFAAEFDAAIDGLVIGLDPRVCAGFGGGILLAEAFAQTGVGLRLAQGDSDAVAVERGGGIAAGDVDAGERGEIQAGGEVVGIGDIGKKQGMAFWMELEGAEELVAGMMAKHGGVWPSRRRSATPKPGKCPTCGSSGGAAAWIG